MYIIIVYDVNVDRVNKVNKFLKAYLHWQQNSVFEGKVTKSQYNEIIDKLNNFDSNDPESRNETVGFFLKIANFFEEFIKN